VKAFTAIACSIIGTFTILILFGFGLSLLLGIPFTSTTQNAPFLVVAFIASCCLLPMIGQEIYEKLDNTNA